MSSLKPSRPQGTRDFDPATVRKRNYIFNTIRTVFELYGFQPLETPAMEQMETLMGKYGEEGDKLIFKILNNGLDDPKNVDKARKAFENVLEGKNDKDLTERALRYDLTIPFARYVAMNHGQLTFPFKRYQMQPVWRADRPQKGRYREFYQCDADVVGSQSLLNEVELTSIYRQAFQQLAIPIEIRINNRKILAALAEVCGGADKMTDITIAIDKLDKIGLEKVKTELAQRGLSNDQVAAIEQYLGIAGDNTAKLSQLKTLFAGNATGLKGIDELEYLLAYTAVTSLDAPHSPGTSDDPTPILVDLTLARGLNYYTGTIFEVKATTVQMGSIGGGGRYDDLTGLFGVPNIPGVGISFGVDRIYDVMEELKLFPEDVHTGTKILFFNLGEAESRAAFGLLQQLRTKGIPAEIYHEQAKFDKQFKYAEKKGIRYAVILGSEELGNRQCKIKDLSTGEQRTLGWEELVGSDF
ncbi:MAG: histidine--tRNA ligase [Chitinophagaceae bacterium]|nr:histidine--tRNA ligase [Chitinophagaceae bacterium]